MNVIVTDSVTALEPSVIVKTTVCDVAVSKSIAVVSATVTAPPVATANAPLSLPLWIVNPALVASSPEEVKVTTAAPFATFSAIVGDAAAISIATSVTVIVNCVEPVLESALVARIVTVHDCAVS